MEMSSNDETRVQVIFGNWFETGGKNLHQISVLVTDESRMP